MATVTGLCLAIALLVPTEASSIEDVLEYSRVRRADIQVPWYQRIWDFHQYYKTLKHEDGALWFWQELSDDALHKTLSDLTDGYDEVDIEFEFRFYGHTIKRIYLSTRGLLSMSPLEEGLSSNHFIAPFYGIFDLSKGEDSAIYFESRHLGTLNFQTHVYKDGKVVFLYRTIQMPQDFSIDSAEFLFGIVGSININIAVSFSYNLICVNKDAKAYPEVNDVKSRVAVQKSQRGSICSPPIYTHVSFFEKRPNCINTASVYVIKSGLQVLVYYDPVQVFPVDIKSGTAIEFIPLETCDIIRDQDSCENNDLDFDCRWCSVTSTCSDGLDRYTEDWETSGCLDEELSLIKPNFGISSTASTPPASSTASTPPAVGKPISTSKPPPAQSSSKVGIIVIIIIIVIILGAIGGWLFYAYKNPTSKSGIWLMEHRPSQWKNLLAARRGFSRHAEAATN